MKKLYENQKYSIPYLGKAIGIKNDILYKYVYGKAKVDNMTIKLLYEISKIENKNMNDLYLEMKQYLGG